MNKNEIIALIDERIADAVELSTKWFGDGSGDDSFRALCSALRKGAAEPAPPPDGPGTPHARLSYLLNELCALFPGVVDPLSSQAPEPMLLDAIKGVQSKLDTVLAGNEWCDECNSPQWVIGNGDHECADSNLLELRRQIFDRNKQIHACMQTIFANRDRIAELEAFVKWRCEGLIVDTNDLEACKRAIQGYTVKVTK